MELFKDKIAIVTGGGSGIGRGISKELATRGAKVIVADINAAGAEETAALIKANGGFAKAVKLDVTIPDDVRSVIDKTSAEFGKLDYMFNNAGIGLVGNFEDLELSHWKQIVDVNLWGVIHGSMYAYRVMLKQGSGHIVNTASLAGLAPSSGAPYPTTKFGVVGLTLSLRIEAALNGIKASVVCPGFIKTPIFDTGIDVSNQFTEEEKNEFLSKFKMASPEECARAIMKGIIKNRTIIPVTSLAWTFWRLYRMFPEFIIKVIIKQTKKFYNKRAKGRG
jgi:NAD(P)-dependent dehydrogenase (short-subunit alcohol dehydrogenase family)